MSMHENEVLEPLAIVAGLRTPFARAFGPLAKVPADELGRVVVDGLLKRAGIEPAQVDEVIFGNVAGPAEASNVARVISLRSGIPADRIGHTVNRNCASGMEAIFAAWQSIREGRSHAIIAGGTESMSNVPFLWDPRFKDLMLRWNSEKSLWKKLGLLGKFRLGMLKPVVALQVGLTDPTCGLNMGETAEVLAREFQISRLQQDEFAMQSHQRALAAWDRCFLGGETIPFTEETTHAKAVAKDTGPRPGQSLEALGKLKPIFDRQSGTVTVGNSCPITDGAVATLVMSVSRARELEMTPLGYVRAYSLAGCDPRRMGLGPVYAIDRLLKSTGYQLSDFDLFEINEAFAVQVLACLQAMSSETFCREELGRTSAIGTIDQEKLNVNGGAIALGHPVGSTGTRLVMTLLRALKEKNLRRGLASLCVGGGQGAAVIVETELDS